MEGFGKRLKEARKAQDLSGTTLGEACGVSKQLVSHWEHGLHVPNVVQLDAICRMVNKSPDFLLYGADETLSQAEMKLVKDLRSVEALNQEMHKWLVNLIHSTAESLRQAHNILATKHGVKNYVTPKRAAEKLKPASNDTPPAHGDPNPVHRLRRHAK